MAKREIGTIPAGNAAARPSIALEALGERPGAAPRPGPEPLACRGAALTANPRSGGWIS
jgi:hypothetical protein